MTPEGMIKKLWDVIEAEELTDPNNPARAILKSILLDRAGMQETITRLNRRAQAAEAELSDRAMRHRAHMERELDRTRDRLLEVQGHAEVLQRMIDRHQMKHPPVTVGGCAEFERCHPGMFSPQEHAKGCPWSGEIFVCQCGLRSDQHGPKGERTHEPVAAR